MDNQFRISTTTEWIPLFDPATSNLVTRVPQCTTAELEAAVDSARHAFPQWRTTSIMKRQQIMFRLVELIKKPQNWDRIVASVTLEHGKTLADAAGDVQRGLQMAEQACGIPNLMMGELLEVAQDMETRMYREPLGVVASISPFSTSISIIELRGWLPRRVWLHRSTDPVLKQVLVS
jgi:malonate-semialdehyde dehydrogenase (acetylating)/methylmalonate-semialdehyde dehydrogenase